MKIKKIDKWINLKVKKMLTDYNENKDMNKKITEE